MGDQAAPQASRNGANTIFAALCAGLAVALMLCGGSAEAAVGVDKTVTTNQASASNTIVSPTFSTTATGELLLAFVSSDGPSAGGTQTFSKVTGGGLTWRLRRRVNAQAGTSEIWAANAAAKLTNASVTATRSNGSYVGSITVVTFTGADQAVDGTTAGASASTGAPSVALTTTRAGAWVWGVGNDWDKATARTAGPNQTKVAEFLASVGDTFWVQRQNTATQFAATPVTLNDTAPTNDRWNMAAVEVLPAVVDTQAPTAPTNLAAGTVTATQVPLSWSASSDDQGVAGYRVFRGASQVGEPTGTSFTDTTVAASTSYMYTVRAYDIGGNVSPASDPLSVTTPALPVDTTPPTTSLTAPVAGATVSGTVNLTATASDASGIAGVQFLLDGNPIGSEDKTSPYGLSWDSNTTGNGSHQLAARAKDGAGNLATSSAVTVTVANGGGPAQVGQWGPLIPLPAVAIHSALLPNGRILLFQGDFAKGGQQYVLDPQTGAVTNVPEAKADLFCAGQAVLADGRVLVVGGTATDYGLGVDDITAFNWQSNTWTELAPMQYPRWYATGTTLSDGKVLAMAGYNLNASDIVTVPELYSPATNSWQSMPAASRSMETYPFIYQLPDGRVAHLGGSEYPTVSEVLDLSTNKWTTFDNRTIDGGSIANYAPGRFIKSGSAADDGFSGNSAKTAYTLDMNTPGTTWQPTGNMNFPRSFLNLTNLPDGTVLATGGSTDKSGFTDANGVLQAEAWNPSTGAWTTYASMSAPRLYHSVAVLLPDGRVYVSGGGGDPGVTDQKSAQLFSPPYLFKGPRPIIDSAPETVKYGASTFVGTPDAASIKRVSLIRTGSVTHAFDQNARATSLNFTQTAGGLDVEMPANRNDVPPGYYMLFIVNDQGVPSVASFVRFPAPYEDTAAPSAPTDLKTSGSVGAVSLSWTAASDDTAVTRYNVHRSSTPGFTPTAANRVGQTGSNSFADTGIAAGTWYYKVTAEDAAGNVGPASSEASATATLDTTPPSAPTGLKAAAGESSVTLTWSASSDNVGVSGYRVARSAPAATATTASTTYSDTGLTPSTTYAYTVTAYDAAGNESPSSAPASATTTAATSFALDKVVTTRQSSASSTISAPALTTSKPGELLLAFIGSDGPNASAAQSIKSVSGGGLTWTLRQRANGQAGTAEIWQAVAAATLNNTVITATRANGSYQGAITIAAFVGADTAVNGASTSGSAATGAPSLSLVTTRAGSWVWGVGEDWDSATVRTVGPGQTLVDQFLSPSGDTFWTQRQTAPTPLPGTTVTISDTAPTADRWDLAIVEVRPAAGP